MQFGEVSPRKPCEANTLSQMLCSALSCCLKEGPAGSQAHPDHMIFNCIFLAIMKISGPFTSTSGGGREGTVDHIM